MSLPAFPSNPEDGMIFEITPGTFYIYSSGSNCWNRFDGADALGLATSLEDGLMAKEDFVKLRNLLIPPPQASLQGEECDLKFSAGTVGLYSFDDSLNISASPDVINKVNGKTVGGPTPWVLHKNTAGFDFKVNTANLLNEIEMRGLLNKVQLQGDSGVKGKKGIPGIDRLDTGPVGPTGIDGANTPFAGTLTTESINFEKVDQTSNRAIVDIVSEDISDTESRLVVTRANIGNPDACPSEVIPKDLDSELLVVLNTVTGGKFVRNQVIQSSSGDCSLICRICASSIHHLNFEPIVADLVEKFRDRLQVLKTEKEELVLIWLQTMIELFNQQKQALCCALENCKSRGRNQSSRQYIETQRIQAALGDFSIKIGETEDKTLTDMDAFKDCPVPAQPSNSIIFKSGGVIFNLDAKIHITDPRTGNQAQSLTAYLPPGSYVAEITECCANFNQSAQGNQFSGRSAILYQVATVVGNISNIETNAITFPDLGEFNNRAAAANAYRGVTILFEHAGGNVSAWLLDPDGFVENNDNGVQIEITDVTQVASSSPPAESIFAYRNEVASENFVGRIIPYVGGLTAAENLGVDSNGNVSPVTGPSLNSDVVTNYFYSGSDGLHFNLVAGAPGPTGPTGATGPDFQANIQVRFEITNNPLQATVVEQNPNTDIKQLTTTEFIGPVNVDNGSSGFVVGPIESSSNYSVIFDPVDLDTMRFWNASDTEGDLLLAEGGSDGIGAQVTEVRSVDATALFDEESVPDGFGGGNQSGLQVENNISNQLVSITRPISLEIPSTVEDDGDDPRDVVPEDPIALEPPPSVPSTPITPFITPPTDSKGFPLTEAGEPVVGEEASALPRGAVGSPQDPCIQDVTISIFADSIVSTRYVFTDNEGNKYYSAFASIAPGGFATLPLVGNWTFLSLGPPVQIIAPPEIFTESVINAKNVEVSELTDVLTNSQLKKAESLTGISRLTFVQEIIGEPLDKVPNGRNMVDFELEFQNSPIGFQILGVITVSVGLPGSITEFVLDDFALPSVPFAAGGFQVTGRDKRTVATISGTDATNGGLLFVGLDSYYGDYQGFNVSSNEKVFLDFQGNNFFVANSEGQSRVMDVTSARGFKDLFNRLSGSVIVASDSGTIRGDAVIVSDFGTVYIADGIGGVIHVIQAPVPAANRSFGDAHDGRANVIVRYVDGLPKSSTPPVMAVGRKFINGGRYVDEIIVNFDGEWFKFNGVEAIQWSSKFGTAFRADLTTPRCCFLGGPPGRARPVNWNAQAIALRGGVALQSLGTGSGGNSLTTDRDQNPQPALPVRSSGIDQGLANAIQAELDQEFNQFSFFSLDGDTIYKVTPETGSREIIRELPDNGFGLRVHPVTKDFYYIVADTATSIPSGTGIRRVDLTDLDEEDRPRVKTVFVAEGNETIFSITFGNTLPAKADFSEMALYALVSDLKIIGSGSSVTTRLIEISESVAGPPPGPELVNKVPSNSDWLSSGTGGQNVNSTGGNPNRIVFTNIPPGAGCQMHYKQVQWYERGWRIGACCGALVEFGGVHYLVVKRSIGVDTTCGGGESEGTTCIRQFIDVGEGHPAIAWPTTIPVDSPPGGGGEEFLGLPTSGFVSFVKDDSLSTSLLNIINIGGAEVIKGDPASEIPFILFPALT